MLEKMCESLQDHREGMLNVHPRVNQWMFQSFDPSAWGNDDHIMKDSWAHDSSTAWRPFHVELVHMYRFSRRAYIHCRAGIILWSIFVRWTCAEK